MNKRQTQLPEPTIETQSRTQGPMTCLRTIRHSSILRDQSAPNAGIQQPIKKLTQLFNLTRYERLSRKQKTTKGKEVSVCTSTASNNILQMSAATSMSVACGATQEKHELMQPVAPDSSWIAANNHISPLNSIAHMVRIHQSSETRKRYGEHPTAWDSRESIVSTEPYLNKQARVSRNAEHLLRVMSYLAIRRNSSTNTSKEEQSRHLETSSRITNQRGTSSQNISIHQHCVASYKALSATEHQADLAAKNIPIHHSTPTFHCASPKTFWT